MLGGVAARPQENVARAAGERGGAAELRRGVIIKEVHAAQVEKAQVELAGKLGGADGSDVGGRDGGQRAGNAAKGVQAGDDAQHIRQVGALARLRGGERAGDKGGRLPRGDDRDLDGRGDLLRHAAA